MSLTNLLIPTYQNMLLTLAGLLGKAEQLAPDQAESLLSARLAPDMYPWPRKFASPPTKPRKRASACAARISRRRWTPSQPRGAMQVTRLDH